MHETHSCPQCGEVLEIPLAMLEQPVRCGACSRVFTPVEPKSAAEFDSEPLPRTRRPRRSFDDPPATGSSNRRALLIIFGVFGLLALACCGGFGFLVYTMMNPTWQTFDSPNGEFTAFFPKGDIQTTTRFTGRPNEQGIALVGRRKLLQEEYFVYFVPLKGVDKDKKPDALLAEFANGLVSQYSGSNMYRPHVSRSHAGHEALEVTLDLNDDRFLQARIVLADNKAYVVGMTGPGEPDNKTWAEEFLDGFQPRAAVAVDKKPANGKKPVPPK